MTNINLLIKNYAGKAPRAGALSLPVVGQSSPKQQQVESFSEGTQDQGLLSVKEMTAKAREWVLENTAKEDHWEEETLFPATDYGNGGTYSYLVQGEAAEKMMEFTRAISLKQNIPFDSEKQAIVAVADTDDDSDLYVSVMDRSTGEVKNVADGDLGLTDYKSYIEKDQFNTIFPSADFPDMKYGDVYEGDIIDALLGENSIDLKTNT